MKAKEKRPGRPTKSSGDKKSESILLRMEEREKLAFAEAAKLAGVPLSVWMRERLRLAAREELEKAGLKIAFIE